MHTDNTGASINLTSDVEVHGWWPRTIAFDHTTKAVTGQFSACLGIYLTHVTITIPPDLGQVETVYGEAPLNVWTSDRCDIVHHHILDNAGGYREQAVHVLQERE